MIPEVENEQVSHLHIYDLVLDFFKHCGVFAIFKQLKFELDTF